MLVGSRRHTEWGSGAQHPEVLAGSRRHAESGIGAQHLEVLAGSQRHAKFSSGAQHPELLAGHGDMQSQIVAPSTLKCWQGQETCLVR